MAPVERITYFAYNDGIDPQRLTLGTLAFDYANPRTSRRSYVPSKSIVDSFKKADLVDEDQRSFCSMLWSQRSDMLFDVDLGKVIKAGHDSTKSDVRLIVGSPGSKIEIKDSDKLFEDHLLKEESVRQWFETRLSVARSIQSGVKNLFSPPSIWLLTGLYIIEDGTVCSVRKETSSNDGSIKVPIPEPTGIAELGKLHLHGTLRLGNGIEAQASHKIEGPKIWAAQWIKVKARYVAKSTLSASPDAIVKQLELQEVWSAGTTRDSGGEDEVVALDLSAESVDDSAEQFDDDWWQEFDKVLEDYLEDMGIEE